MKVVLISYHVVTGSHNLDIFKPINFDIKMIGLKYVNIYGFENVV